MHILSLQEIKSVSGAGFYEDINALSSMLFVAGCISSIASGMLHSAVTLGTTVANVQSASAKGMAHSAASVGAILAPILIGARMLEVNPGMANTLKEKFHTYLG